ncbi:uncharacterized protein LOC129914781 isoform X2 [Episyrphus balteatus]|uniref:uncharacterized protein LOC129914781 isoform X2 n=1 Tax=Episyrphus balteatus TaxID=286459 RepID=UPI002484F36A|nr:uncharacterized protein LOC129914781 isoform X2 [Episyrphus balteatus]
MAPTFEQFLKFTNAEETIVEKLKEAGPRTYRINYDRRFKHCKVLYEKFLNPELRDKTYRYGLVLKPMPSTFKTKFLEFPNINNNEGESITSGTVKEQPAEKLTKNKALHLKDKYENDQPSTSSAFIHKPRIISPSKEKREKTKTKPETKLKQKPTAKALPPVPKSRKSVEKKNLSKKLANAVTDRGAPKITQYFTSNAEKSNVDEHKDPEEFLELRKRKPDPSNNNIEVEPQTKRPKVSLKKEKEVEKENINREQMKKGKKTSSSDDFASEGKPKKGVHKTKPKRRRRLQSEDMVSDDSDANTNNCEVDLTIEESTNSPHENFDKKMECHSSPSKSALPKRNKTEEYRKASDFISRNHFEGLSPGQAIKSKKVAKKNINLWMEQGLKEQSVEEKRPHKHSTFKEDVFVGYNLETIRTHPDKVKKYIKYLLKLEIKLKKGITLEEPNCNELSRSKFISAFNKMTYEDFKNLINSKKYISNWTEIGKSHEEIEKKFKTYHTCFMQNKYSWSDFHIEISKLESFLLSKGIKELIPLKIIPPKILSFDEVLNKTNIKKFVSLSCLAPPESYTELLSLCKKEYKKCVCEGIWTEGLKLNNKKKESGSTQEMSMELFTEPIESNEISESKPEITAVQKESPPILKTLDGKEYDNKVIEQCVRNAQNDFETNSNTSTTVSTVKKKKYRKYGPKSRRLQSSTSDDDLETKITHIVGYGDQAVAEPKEPIDTQELSRILTEIQTQHSNVKSKDVSQNRKEIRKSANKTDDLETKIIHIVGNSDQTVAEPKEPIDTQELSRILSHGEIQHSNVKSKRISENRKEIQKSASKTDDLETKIIHIVGNYDQAVAESKEPIDTQELNRILSHSQTQHSNVKSKDISQNTKEIQKSANKTDDLETKIIHIVGNYDQAVAEPKETIDTQELSRILTDNQTQHCNVKLKNVLQSKGEILKSAYTTRVVGYGDQAVVEPIETVDTPELNQILTHSQTQPSYEKNIDDSQSRRENRKSAFKTPEAEAITAIVKPFVDTIQKDLSERQNESNLNIKQTSNNMTKPQFSTTSTGTLIPLSPNIFAYSDETNTKSSNTQSTQASKEINLQLSERDGGIAIAHEKSSAELSNPLPTSPNLFQSSEESNSKVVNSQVIEVETQESVYVSCTHNNDFHTEQNNFSVSMIEISESEDPFGTIAFEGKSIADLTCVSKKSEDSNNNSEVSLSELNVSGESNSIAATLGSNEAGNKIQKNSIDSKVTTAMEGEITETSNINKRLDSLCSAKPLSPNKMSASVDCTSVENLIENTHYKDRENTVERVRSIVPSPPESSELQISEIEIQTVPLVENLTSKNVHEAPEIQKDFNTVTNQADKSHQEDHSQSCTNDEENTMKTTEENTRASLDSLKNVKVVVKREIFSESYSQYDNDVEIIEIPQSGPMVIDDEETVPELLEELLGSSAFTQRPPMTIVHTSLSHLTPSSICLENFPQAQQLPSNFDLTQSQSNLNQTVNEDIHILNRTINAETTLKNTDNARDLTDCQIFKTPQKETTNLNCFENLVLKKSPSSEKKSKKKKSDGKQKSLHIKLSKLKNNQQPSQAISEMSYVSMAPQNIPSDIELTQPSSTNQGQTRNLQVVLPLKEGPIGENMEEVTKISNQPTENKRIEGETPNTQESGISMVVCVSESFNESNESSVNLESSRTNTKDKRKSKKCLNSNKNPISCEEQQEGVIGVQKKRGLEISKVKSEDSTDQNDGTAEDVVRVGVSTNKNHPEVVSKHNREDLCLTNCSKSISNKKAEGPEEKDSNSNSETEINENEHLTLPILTSEDHNSVINNSDCVDESAFTKSPLKQVKTRPRSPFSKKTDIDKDSPANNSGKGVSPEISKLIVPGVSKNTDETILSPTALKGNYESQTVCPLIDKKLTETIQCTGPRESSESFVVPSPTNNQHTKSLKDVDENLQNKNHVHGFKESLEICSEPSQSSSKIKITSENESYSFRKANGPHSTPIITSTQLERQALSETESFGKAMGQNSTPIITSTQLEPQALSETENNDETHNSSVEFIDFSFYTSSDDNEDEKKEEKFSHSTKFKELSSPLTNIVEESQTLTVQNIEQSVKNLNEGSECVLPVNMPLNSENTSTKISKNTELSEITCTEGTKRILNRVEVKNKSPSIITSEIKEGANLKEPTSPMSKDSVKIISAERFQNVNNSNHDKNFSNNSNIVELIEITGSESCDSGTLNSQTSQNKENLQSSTNLQSLGADENTTICLNMVENEKNNEEHLNTQLITEHVPEQTEGCSPLERCKSSFTQNSNHQQEAPNRNKWVNTNKRRRAMSEKQPQKHSEMHISFSQPSECSDKGVLPTSPTLKRLVQDEPVETIPNRLNSTKNFECTMSRKVETFVLPGFIPIKFLQNLEASSEELVEVPLLIEKRLIKTIPLNVPTSESIEKNPNALMLKIEIKPEQTPVFLEHSIHALRHEVKSLTNSRTRLSNKNMKTSQGEVCIQKDPEHQNIPKKSSTQLGLKQSKTKIFQPSNMKNKTTPKKSLKLPDFVPQKTHAFSSLPIGACKKQSKSKTPSLMTVEECDFNIEDASQPMVTETASQMLGADCTLLENSDLLRKVDKIYNPKHPEIPELQIEKLPELIPSSPATTCKIIKYIPLTVSEGVTARKVWQVNLQWKSPKAMSIDVRFSVHKQYMTVCDESAKLLFTFPPEIWSDVHRILREIDHFEYKRRTLRNQRKTSSLHKVLRQLFDSSTQVVVLKVIDDRYSPYAICEKTIPVYRKPFQCLTNGIRENIINKMQFLKETLQNKN